MIRFALVGCGRIAQRHSEILGERKVEGARLEAVCDLEISKAKLIGDRYNVPYFTNVHEMAAKTAVDVFVVLTESGNHARDVLSLVKYKKHIIVEKPMALRIEDADNMIRACEEAGIKLFVVKQNRFNLPVRQLRKALDEGRFGRIILGTVRVRWSRDEKYYRQANWRGTWSLDGGVLANQASHHVDLLTWMLGEVEEVTARATTASVKIEAEDTAIAIMRFKSGALGVIEATTAVRPTDLEGSLSVIGENGVAEIAGFAVNKLKTWQFNDANEDQSILSTFSENPPNVYGFGHQSYYEHVMDCLTKSAEPRVNGKEGRKSLELLSAIYSSIASKNSENLKHHTPHPHLGMGR